MCTHTHIYAHTTHKCMYLCSHVSTIFIHLYACTICTNVYSLNIHLPVYINSCLYIAHKDNI